MPKEHRQVGGERGVAAWGWAVLLLVAGSACDCGGGVDTTCATRADCPGDQVCVDGLCRPPADGGAPPQDAGPADAASDASGDAGGPDARAPECTVDDDCDGEARCLGGVCCGAADVCAGRCCDGAAGEVCFAGACVTPGRSCTTHADCGEGAWCERGLAETGGTGGGMGGGGMGEGVCLGETPSPGRCLSYPPDCDSPGADPASCIRASCEYVPTFDRLNATVQWRWGAVHDPPEPEEVAAEEASNRIDVWSTPAVGRVHDTNCDGVVDRNDPPAVVFVSANAQSSFCSNSSVDTCRRGVLRALDGKTGRELWTLRRAEDGSMGFAGVSVALADVDGVPGMEIVVLTGEGKMAVVGGDGTVRALSTETVALQVEPARSFGWGGGLAIADMEGDGTLEVAYGYELFEIVDGTPRRRWRGTAGSGRLISTFADVDGDGTLELVAANTVYEPDGTVLWRNAGVPDGYPAVADFDADGNPEVVVVYGTRPNRTVPFTGFLSVLDGGTGAVRWGPLRLGGTGFGGPPTVADFDGDGRPEVGVAQADYYSLVDVEPDASPVLSIKWRAPTHDYSSSVTGSTVFDFEGDGRAEVVYNDECFLWVYDGQDGSVRFVGSTTSFTATEASLVADVDGDGHAEILMVSNGANPAPRPDLPLWHCAHHQPGGSPEPDHGPLPAEAVWEPGPATLQTWRGITLWRDAENSWVGTRALWNQHTYHVTNVCSERDSACDPPGSEGSVPAREQPNWRLGWLNNFRQNVQESGLFDAPDATVSLEAICETPPRLVANVRNRGRAILPAGVVVGFYVREADGTERRLGEARTSRDLFPGQGEPLEFVTPDGTPTDATFFARIEVDPAARTFRECDEDNNQSDDARPVCLG